jgi:uncharacterized coiled-coil protein SlyX
MAQAPAQTGPADAGSNTPKLEDLVQKLERAITAQQQAMTEQQKQISDQRQEIETLRQQMSAQPQAMSATSGNGTPVLVDASLATLPTSSTSPSLGQEVEKPKESPLSFHIGGAQFTPGGFVDLTAFWRNTNPGTGYGTNFFSIPFHNTIPGQLTETRFTAENSRITLKVTDKFKGNDVTGYYEMDFHGNDPANLNVTSNSSTMRLRQFWVDVRRNKWEFLGGQAWSWLTPNRVGMSAMPADVFYSQNVDANYQLGLTWTRAPQVRVIFHPNDHWGIGLAAENPDQFAGQAGQVIFPAAFNNAAVTSQFDIANQTTTPNVMPDIIPKIAYDTDFGGKHFHVEAVGLVTRLRVVPALGVAANSVTAGGGSLNMNLEVVKNFRLFLTSFFSDGGGRYIFGSGPDAVLRPDGTLSLVHAYSGVGGFEWQINQKTLISAYYGADYFQRNFFLDTSAGAKPNTFAGYGGPGSSNAANRSIQEPTLDWVTTFWKNPQYGALQLMTQVSYLTRSPWDVPAGTPKNARSSMAWANVRYVLP